MKKLLAKVTLVASMTFLLSLSLNIQSAHASGWLTPQWFNSYFSNWNTSQTNQQQNQTTTTTNRTQTQTNTSTTQTTTTNSWSQPTTTNQSQASPSTTMASQERQMADMVNRERTQRGQRSLIIDPELSRWARIKSQDMINNNYFGHQSPTYGRVSDMLRNGGVSFRFAGENLARAGNITTAHNMLMNSSVHRSNILNNNYTHVGIGIAQKGSTLYITQIFAAR